MPLMSTEIAPLAPDVWCIRLNGEVDSSNLARLRQAFDEIFARKVYKVVLNLGAIKYLSSSAIGCVLGGFTTAVKNGGRLVLAATPHAVVEVLKLIGVANLLTFAPDETSAVSAFAPPIGSGHKPR
jgi:anti-anti-sigma factor